MLGEAAEGMLPEELTAALASGVVFQSRYPEVKTSRETNRVQTVASRGLL